VCQRNILLVFSLGCLKIDTASLFKRRSISDEFVSVLMDTILVVFGLKVRHEWKGGWVLEWHCCFGSMLFDTTFHSNKDVF
jgi:hypothetical protein